MGCNAGMHCLLLETGDVKPLQYVEYYLPIVTPSYFIIINYRYEVKSYEHGDGKL
jgi:hypothetical protein